MMVQMCSHCDKLQQQKPTIKVRGASAYRRERKLNQLASIITIVSYPGISYEGENKEKAKTKAASSIEVEKSKAKYMH